MRQYKELIAPNPKAITIYFTERCNLRCVMCPHHGSKSLNKRAYRRSKISRDISINGPDFSEQQLHNIAEIIRSAELIQYIGGGEPLLTPRILEKLDYVHSLNRHGNIELYTNGTLLRCPDFIRKVFSSINSLHLSLNGTSSYNKIMLGSDFKTIVQNLSRISEVRDQVNHCPALSLDFVLMKSNLRDILSVVKLAKEYGFDNVCFKDMWVGDVHLKKESVKHAEKYLQLAGKLLNKAKIFAAETDLEVFCDTSLEKSLQQNNLQSGFNPEVGESGFYCVQPWETVRIANNGDVIMCCNGTNIIGSLNNNNFQEIWNGEEARNYRQGMLSGQYYGGCNHCKLLRPLDPKSYEQ